MLNRLPKELPPFAELVRDIGNPTSHELAAALGVSERTIRRWMTKEAPRNAGLCLWWLSCEGHNVWDSEMQNRTALALATNSALWREVRLLRQTAFAFEGTNAAALDDERGPRRLSLVR